MSMEVYIPNDDDIIHQTQVDFRKRPILQTVHLVQYDKSLPVIEVELLRNDFPYTCPNEAEVFVRWLNKDSSIVYKKCKVSSDRKKVYFEVDENMTQFRGEVKSILELNVGDRSSGSSPMSILIDRNPF